MFHLEPHSTLNTSTSSLSPTSPVLLSSSAPNPDLLSTHPLIHCEDLRQDGTSTEFHSSTEPGDDSKPDEDSKTEVDDEAVCRMQLEVREKEITKDVWMRPSRMFREENYQKKLAQIEQGRNDMSEHEPSRGCTPNSTVWRTSWKHHSKLAKRETNRPGSRETARINGESWAEDERRSASQWTLVVQKLVKGYRTLIHT